MAKKKSANLPMKESTWYEARRFRRGAMSGQKGAPENKKYEIMTGDVAA